jgi:Mce-associated membrane protein
VSTIELAPEEDVVDETSTRNPWGHRRRIALWCWITLALIAFGWFGGTWAFSVFGGGAGAARDEALSGARQAAINMYSFDPADPKGSFELMRTSMTGSQINGELDVLIDALGEQPIESAATTKAEVLAASITQLSADAGEATAIAMVKVASTWPTGAYQITQFSVRIALLEVEGIWKAAGMERIGDPVYIDASDGLLAVEVPAEEIPVDENPVDENPAEGEGQ